MLFGVPLSLHFAFVLISRLKSRKAGRSSNEAALNPNAAKRSSSPESVEGRSSAFPDSPGAFSLHNRQREQGVGNDRHVQVFTP